MQIFPDKPYSSQQIRRYVASHTRCHDGLNLSAAEYKKQICEVIETLPAWAQIIVMEKNVTFAIGDHDQLKVREAAGGYYNPMLNHINSLPYTDTYFKLVICHEIAHALDYLCGSRKMRKHEVVKQTPLANRRRNGTER